jgi:DNA-directed RNA polymerase subunit RPC12/RpoP
VRCVACAHSFEASAVDVGADVTCPHCATTVRLGPAVREVRRVRRTAAGVVESGSLARIVTCSACAQVFDSRSRAEHDEPVCPSCGARCGALAPATAQATSRSGGRRAFWLGLLAGVGIASAVSAIVAVSVVAWVLAQRKG